MDALHRLVERLCRSSERSPEGDLDWPDALAPDEWCFSPELLSVYGTPAYDALSESMRRRLAFHEAVNFFSLNLHGERVLVRGLALRARSPEWRALAPYLVRFRADEERHMASFGEFCRRYAGGIHPDRSLATARPSAPGEEDVLFFAKVLVFEEIVDAYNVHMAADERLARVVRDVNRLHHVDECRHLAFGRAVVKELWTRVAPSWSAATVDRVRATVAQHVCACLRDYASVDAYRDAGIADPYGVRREALEHPATAARQHRLAARCRRALPDLFVEATR